LIFKAHHTTAVMVGWSCVIERGFIFISLVYFCNWFAFSLRECQQSDFHFEYTECDKFGGRWRVAVPDVGTCTGGKPPAPVRGRDCSFSCPPGTFLHLQSQNCQSCPAGTYSLGGGIRYDDFLNLPKGFRIVNEISSAVPIQTSLIDNNDKVGNFDDPSFSCNGTGWQIRGGTLTYIPSPCLSTLLYNVKLVRPGFVRYKYIYPDNGVFLSFHVQNEQCLSVNDNTLSKHTFPPTTTDTNWNEEEVSLSSGPILLSWKAMVLHGQHRPIVIKSIEIRGVAYTQECTLCPNGTFSVANSGVCQPCQPGTYSNAGASSCSQCDKLSEYSGPKAAKCQLRPPCTVHDYYAVHSACDHEKKATINYRWSEPKICRSDLAGAVQLPESQLNVKCPPCNPGTFLRGGRCRICPKNYFSSGNEECQLCPANTQPDYEYSFIWWNELPENVTSTCQTLEGNTCDGSESWLPLGDRISTSHSRRNDVYLSLILEVAGFRSTANNDVQTPVGVVTFVFQTQCIGDCAFFFVEIPQSVGRPTIIGDWNGTVSKRSFSYQVHRPERTVFQWIFVRSQLSTEERMQNRDVSFDEASLYVINVTNTINGGASRCLLCPVHQNTKECLPCPPGHFIVNESGSCAPCPAGTFLNTSINVGPEACIPCGQNLQSRQGVECVANCKLQFNDKQYDLSPLNGVYEAKSLEIFSRDGSRYFHLFNVSICGAVKATCKDTIDQLNPNSVQIPTIHSDVCKVTVLPRETDTLFANPLSIGDRLVGISSSLRFDQLTIPENVIEQWHFPQVFFLYKSFSVSRSCANGYYAIVTFRCDPASNSSKISLPSTCPDGTCDGCLYQVVITSRFACPICSAEDYKEIVGECVHNLQTIHRIPAKHCILIGQDHTESTVVRCQSISFQVQLIIAVATAVIVFLFITLLLIRKKNQKLQYKYMKLVQSASGKDAELPGAESCALTEDEEDIGSASDRILFVHGKGKSRTSGWLTLDRKSTTENGYESTALTAASD
ncbi:Uncharacterized protein T4A_9565, partial [Trichinella pseudospiralis]